MFYSHEIVGKKGALGILWCAMGRRRDGGSGLAAPPRAALHGAQLGDPGYAARPRSPRILAHKKNISKRQIVNADLRDLW